MDRIARVSEIIAGSPHNFEDAIKAGFERANRTLRGRLPVSESSNSG